MMYNPAKKAAKKAAKRLRFKTSMNEQAEEDAQRGQLFSEVPAAARSSVAQLWSCLLGVAKTFDVAQAFWPPSLSFSSMCKDLTDNILRNIAALKWRILSRLAQAPFSYVDLQKFLTPDGLLPTGNDEGQEDEELSRKLEGHLQNLLQSEACCLDWNWARPVRDAVLATAVADRTKCFAKHLASFLSSFRGSSLQEETMHALQRKIAGGDAGQARRFHSQAASFVVQRLSRAFMRRGGRDLATAGKAVQSAAQIARVKKTVHKRPQQFGSAVFSYIAHARAQNKNASFQELMDAWRNMDVATKNVWRSRQALQVRMKRRADAAVREAAANAAPMETTWGVGDADFPLRQEFIDNLLAPFRTRASGLAKLQEFDDSECRAYKRRVESGETKYHSMDAARYACQAALTAPVNVDMVRDLANPILSVRCESASCPMIHPGLCVTRHAAQVDDVLLLVKALPADACLLRCEASVPRKAKFVVYAKAVVGQAGDPGFALCHQCFLNESSQGHAAMAMAMPLCRHTAMYVRSSYTVTCTPMQPIYAYNPDRVFLRRHKETTSHVLCLDDSPECASN